VRGSALDRKRIGRRLTNDHAVKNHLCTDRDAGLRATPPTLRFAYASPAMYRWVATSSKRRNKGDSHVKLRAKPGQYIYHEMGTYTLRDADDSVILQVPTQFVNDLIRAGGLVRSSSSRTAPLLLRGVPLEGSSVSGCSVFRNLRLSRNPSICARVRYGP
jgi:hypothetical protein